MLNNKWYLFNLDGTRVIEQGYDKIYLLDESNMAVYDNGYISFVDYTGNLVCDDKIKVSSLFGSMPKNPEGIKFDIFDNIVDIRYEEGTDWDNSKSYHYTYNLDTKILTKVES